MSDLSIETHKGGTKRPTRKAHILIPEKAAVLGRRMLGNVKTEVPAGVVYDLVDAIVEGAIYSLDHWDIDAIAAQLKIHEIVLTEVEENQIQAISSIRRRPNLVILTGCELKNLVLPINHEIPNVDVDEVVDVEHLNWFVAFLKDYLPNVHMFLDYGALEYVARVLHSEGFFVPPHNLRFAKETLEGLNQNTDDYEDMVRKAIEDPEAPQNSIVKAQLKKHESTEQYVRHMLSAHREGLKKLV